MNIGFTGTRQGMTEDQKEVFVAVVTSLLGKSDGDLHQLHQGCCIGADEGACRLVRSEWGDVISIIGYPCDIREAQSRYALEVSDELRTEKRPLDRNLDIVLASEVLVACPKEFFNEIRSGTWSTVRAARRSGRKLVIILPDGQTREETP